jgi:polar amino acid transport system substrate-binding protein
MLKQWGTVCALALAFALPSLSANAQLLDAIQKRGKLIVAVDLGFPPWGSTNDKREPDGADVETAKLLAKDLGVELEVVAVTAPNRVPVLLTNKADVTMSSFSITAERAKSIAFSNPYGVTSGVLVATKNVAMKSLADLAGKKIGIPRGTTQDGQLTAEAPKDAQLVRFDNDATSIAALLAGQVDAIATGGALGNKLAREYPDRQYENKFTISETYYAIGMRRGDPDFRLWLNTWIMLNLKNGKLGAIYEKWIGSPLPATLPVF